MTAASAVGRTARAKSSTRRTFSVSRVAAWFVLGVMAVFGVYSITQMGVSAHYLVTMPQKIHTFFGSTSNAISFPSPANLAYLIGLTLGVVVLGTVIAALISIPVAYISASNTAPASLRWLGRTIGVLTRAIPDVVIAFAVSLMFALGSTLPGIIAIGIHSIGMISKLFADAIEQIDEGPRLAIRAAGGSKAQEFWGGVFPQVLPSWTSTTLHRFDINLRGSVILGYAGVGGLGYAMSLAFNQFQYGRGIGIAIVVFLLCVLLEVVSSTIRVNLLGAGPSGTGFGDRIVRAIHARRASSVRDTGGKNGGGNADELDATNASPVDHETRFASPEAALHRPWTFRRARNMVWVLAAIALIGLSIWWAQIRFDQILWPYVWPSVLSFWPPSLGVGVPTAFFTGLFSTLQVAFAAAVVAFVFSVILGSLAARNIAPNTVVRNVFRVILTFLRGIPELVVALFLIVIIGLGTGPAFIAMIIGGIGLLGKLIADSFEEVPNGPETALSAAGATRLQRYLASTLPQGLPSLIGNALYLIDSNIRSATLLGIVGAGGIGYYLAMSAPYMNMHGQVTTLVAIILVVVLALEGIAIWLRHVFK